MTRRIKTNLKIVVAAASCVFSLATLFTGTIAWFSMNQSVSTTGLSVTVGKLSNIEIVSCYAVRYDGTSGAIAFDISGGNANIAMSEYDFVFKDRNVNTPLFIRMEIAHFDTSKDLSVTIPCTGSYKTNDLIDPYLSNVVAAKLLCGLGADGSTPDTNVWSGDTGNGVTSSAVVSSYQGMLAYAHENEGTPFVANDTKRNSITLSLDHEDVFDNSFIFSRNGKDVAVAYIVLDYYVENGINLVEDYIGSYEEAEVDDYEISFTSDISTMTLGNEGNS